MYREKHVQVLDWVSASTALFQSSSTPLCDSPQSVTLECQDLGTGSLSLIPSELGSTLLDSIRGRGLSSPVLPFPESTDGLPYPLIIQTIIKTAIYKRSTSESSVHSVIVLPFTRLVSTPATLLTHS